MSNNPALSEPTGYEAWLGYRRAASGSRVEEYAAYTSILVEAKDDILQNAAASKYAQHDGSLISCFISNLRRGARDPLHPPDKFGG
ncbi:MAG: hypothetical protein E6Z15_18250, partial [Paenibacillus macerans]|nr:hypothetical protein [Paenibacillus macerans]